MDWTELVQHRSGLQEGCTREVSLALQLHLFLTNSSVSAQGGHRSSYPSEPRARKALGDPSNLRRVKPILGAPDGAPVPLTSSWGQVTGTSRGSDEAVNLLTCLISNRELGRHLSLSGSQFRKSSVIWDGFV